MSGQGEETEEGRAGFAMSQIDFNAMQVLAGFPAGREEVGNYLQRTILRLLLIDYIERRHGINLSIDVDEEEIDLIIRQEVS